VAVTVAVVVSVVVVVAVCARARERKKGRKRANIAEAERLGALRQRLLERDMAVTSLAIREVCLAKAMMSRQSFRLAERVDKSAGLAAKLVKGQKT